LVYSQIWLNLPKDHKLTHSAGFCGSSKHRKTTGLKFHPSVKPLASNGKRTVLALKLSIVRISSFISSFVSSSTIYFSLIPLLLIGTAITYAVFHIDPDLLEFGIWNCFSCSVIFGGNGNPNLPQQAIAAGGGVFAMGTVVVARLLACVN
jgi:hypothetical protein